MRKAVDWKKLENEIILKSKVVCCTLNIAGSEKLKMLKGHVDVLIIDEACQSAEPSCIIPMEFNPKRIILVGDQKQLAATTFSNNASTTKYDRSLFERLLDAEHSKTMLTT